ncbi:MAG: T9SS type A sorting domain-containing protein [Flavobacteriales bacterium]|nr:T9SS type A sorting domain-containing protein [Flavobacteriales bacterium]MBP9078984.1 T9SS type A sorting domain-containing protein [Flavobacteriales bacterium]
MTTRLLLASIALGALLPAIAQIPNGGFENWSTPPGATYQDPDQWITFNALTSMIPGMGLSCEKVAPGAAGGFCVKVTTRQATGIGVMPGIISVGDMMTGATGFPYTSRPATLTGQWQYNILAGDSGTLVVALSKWNPATQTSDVIGGAAVLVTGNATGWQAMNIPFTYNSPATPDSAFILAASSIGSGVAGSWIQLDALAFSGSATGITEQQAEVLRVYPSPASTWLTVSGGQPMERITIYETTGRVVLAQRMNGLVTELDVAALPQGRYLVRVDLADGTQAVSSFVKR